MNQPHEGQFRQLSEGSFTRAFQNCRRFDHKFFVSDLAICILVSVLTVLMIRHEWESPSLPSYREGQVAPTTIRVRRDIEVIDADATEAEKLQVLSRVPDVYDFDTANISIWVDRWRMAVHHLRGMRGHAIGAGEKASAFASHLGAPCEEKELLTLEKIGFGSELDRSIGFAFGPLYDRKIIDKKVPLPPTMEVVDLKTNKSEMFHSRDYDQMLGVIEAMALVGKAGRDGAVKIHDPHRLPWSRWKPAERNVVFNIQARLVKPNLTYNRKETELRRAAALKEFRPLIQRLAKGEVVVREGERVTHRQSQLIQQLNKGKSNETSTHTTPYEMLFGALTLWIMSLFARKQYPKLLRSPKNSLVAAGGFVTSVAIFKLTLIFQLDVLAEQFSKVPAAFFLFLIPVATPAMILRLLLGPALTVIFSVLYALSTAILMENAGLYGGYIFVSCLSGAYFLANCRTRSAMYRAGVQTACVCGLAAITLMSAWGGKLPVAGTLLRDVGEGFNDVFQTAVWALMGGMVGGWLSSALTLVMTPIFENLLDYTTDLKLLELARMDHPLLRDLVLKAPGTYHHSIIVGSLVEAGAEAIGANALLARVGSYYHDIGKIERAEYFIENQVNGRNPHDQTRPQLSAKIIISHVKEGRALAMQHKLGQDLIDFIEQHHGNSLVSYFYNKAKQDAAQPDATLSPDEVQEENFRYPGPKPQSKENAILALADSCEAATRSLVDPTPARIEGMVNKIINKAFTENLLDEADITLREVHLVGNAFVRILLGIHHNRIQYPDQEKGLPQKIALVRNSR